MIEAAQPKRRLECSDTLGSLLILYFCEVPILRMGAL